MSTTERVLVGFGLLGLTASAAVTTLLWMLMTRPLAVGRLLQQLP